ncbi:gamma-glutamyltransferase [Escherichia coli]
MQKKTVSLITKEDLAAYKAVERTPISGDYRGYQVYSMPPPSSGGIHIVQILNILEKLRYEEIRLWQRRCDAKSWQKRRNTPTPTARNILATRILSKSRGRH